MNDARDVIWVWVSPHGNIKHTYTPKTAEVWRVYIKRGWSITYRRKGETQ